MATQHQHASAKKPRERFVLPDPPEGDPEDMTSFDHLTLSGSVHHLAQHLGNPETTIVAGERYLTRAQGTPAADRMAPDLSSPWVLTQRPIGKTTGTSSQSKGSRRTSSWR